MLDSVPKQTLPVDCLGTIILCLQEAGRSMPHGQEVAETILAMVRVCASVLSSQRLHQDLHVLTTLDPEGAHGQVHHGEVDGGAM